MKKIIVFSFIYLLLFPIRCVVAQQNETDSINKSVELNEIIISANKVEEPEQRVAQQVELIKAIEIQQLNAATTAELLQSTGHVSVQKSQQGGGSPVIRGFEASRVLLMIDGVRLNNLIYRAGHLQNAISTDQSAFERVEILFGPSSTVYGSDALGGVIHFYTKKPALADGDKNSVLHLNSFIRYGSVNREKTGHFDLNYGLKKFASFTSFTFSKFEDLKMGTKPGLIDSVFGVRYYYVKRFGDKDSLVSNDDKYLQKFSGYNQYDVLQKFLYKQSDKTEHSLNLQFSNSSDIPRYDRLTDPSSIGLSFAEWYYGPQQRLLGAYDFNMQNLRGFFNSIHAGVNYQHVEESRHQRRFNSSSLSHRTEKADVIGYNLDFQKITEKHNLRTGIDGQYNMLKSTAFKNNIVTGETEPIDTRYPDGDNTMHYAGIYLTHTMQINKKWVLNDGIRMQYVNLHSTFANKDFFPFPFNEVKQTNIALCGNAGIIFLPTDKWKISLTGSTGFRVPNVDDLSKVFESGDGSIIIPNPDLKPEKTINGDLSISKLFGNKLKWENVGFYTLFMDAIVLDKFKFNGQDSIEYDGQLSQVYASQNKQDAFIYGFSSILMADATKHFSFKASVTYTHGRIKTDSVNVPLDHIPPIFGRGEVSYRIHKLKADFSVNFNGWKHLKDYYLNGEDNEQYAIPEGMPAWYTFNISASYKLNKNFELQAGCENILDTQYRAFASGINAPGRNIFGVLRFNY